MTTVGKIQCYVCKLILLVCAYIGVNLLKRYSWYDDFEWRFIHFTPFAPAGIVDTEFIVPTLKSFQVAWRYLKREPEIWDEEEDEEDEGQEVKDEEDEDWEVDDEHAATSLLALTIFAPGFQEAFQEHPEWQKFLI